MTAWQRSMAEWLVEFDQRARDWKESQYESISRSLAAKYESHSRIEVLPVVLVGRHEIDSGSADCPRSARALVKFGLEHGWAVQLWAALAAHPVKGLVASVSLRARRGDEGVIGIWWDGGYECGWYAGPTGFERLGAARIESLSKAAATRAAKAGPGVVPVAVRMRGVADALEGVRLVDASVTREVPLAA